MKKNDIYTAEIIAMSSEGMGICKINNIAVFVGSTAIGDMIEVRIVKVLKNYCFGIVEKIIKASTAREESECKVFSKCGGCVFRHINYGEEALIKETRVKDAITRIGGYKDFNMEKIRACDTRDRYRNKAQIPFGVDNNGELTMGFFGKHSHRIIPVDDCLLQPFEFTEVMQIIKDWYKKAKVSVYNEKDHKGILRHLYLRMGNNELMVCIVINADELPFATQLCIAIKEKIKNVSSIIINVNKEKTNVVLGKTCKTLWGKDFISENLCGLNFNISPLSFFQVNRNQAERLYQKAIEFADLKGEETLVDLYCGTGTIGLCMASKAKKLIGIEIIPQAIENAKINAEMNNIHHAEFICADAGKAVEILEERGEKPDVVVLDPPRKGCDTALIDTVSRMNPKKIVYISCDPASLARDLKVFAEKGYMLQNSQAFDLFPATSHVETVCLLSA